MTALGIAACNASDASEPCLMKRPYPHLTDFPDILSKFRILPMYYDTRYAAKEKMEALITKYGCCRRVNVCP